MKTLADCGTISYYQNERGFVLEDGGKVIQTYATDKEGFVAFIRYCDAHPQMETTTYEPFSLAVIQSARGKIC